jgi:hypothetical protein
VFLATTGDHRLDPARPEQPAVLVMVIATVGQHLVGLMARSARLAGDRPGSQIIK